MDLVKSYPSQLNHAYARTKIVCTLGPASSDEASLRAMIEAGMNLARINLSHGHSQNHASRIKMVRQIAADMGRVVGIIGDLQGPKIRIGKIDPEPLVLEKGMDIVLTGKPTGNGRISVPLPQPQMIRGAQVGGTIWLDDGLIELQVVDKSPGELCCRVVVGGKLTSRKGISAPGVKMNIPAITPKDRDDVRFAVEQQVDYVAMSFVRTARDIESLRVLIASYGTHIPIIAKIERPEAMDNLDKIIEASDAVMVARGDLGVEAVFEEVPAHQMRIISACNRLGRPVITATQMLHSMNEASHPTRAEANDVFTSIHQGTDAVMLSSESAVGAHPVRAVSAMRKIARMAEQYFPFENWRVNPNELPNTSVTGGIGLATCSLATYLGAKAIITNTLSGRTTCEVAKHRPRSPIISTTPNLDTQRRMSLVWGVESLLVSEFQNTDDMIQGVTQAALSADLITGGDVVIVTAGTPVGQAGQTNLIQVCHIK